MKNEYDIEVWEERLEKKRVKRQKYLESWIGFIPQESKCQLCEKVISFKRGIKKGSIHFDHRNGGSEVIKGSPTNWLQYHPRTPENEEIWKNCNFGILCNKCNAMLPTKNRVKIAENLIKYMK